MTEIPLVSVNSSGNYPTKLRREIMNFGFTCDPVSDQDRLSRFELEMIQYSRNSVIVEINHMMPTVEINGKELEDSGWFMEGEEAQSFLDKAETFWNEKDISDEDAVYLAAYEYADAV